jgi:acyl-homoserine lactone acylase PvdQ
VRRPLSAVLLCAAVLATAVPATGQEPDRSHLDPAFLESIDDALLHGTVTPPGAPIEEKQAELDAYDDLVQGYPTLTEDELTEVYFKDGRFREVTDVARDYRPRADVRIVRDARWGVPHIYGDTDEAMAFGAGYAVVEDRLPIMELLRALGRAEAFELLGDNASWLADAEIARLYGYTEEEFQAMLDRVPAEYGQTGQDLVDGLVAYTAGINHAILQIQQGRIPQPAGLADLLPANEIAPWRPTDIVAVVSIVRALFGAGGGGELANAARWLDLVDTYGEEQARAVYADFRNRTNDDGVVHTLDDFPYMTVEGGPRPTAANALGYSSGDTGLQGLLEQLPETLVGLLPTSAGAAAADLAALHETSRIRWENLRIEHPSGMIDLSRAEDAGMSNYVAVDGERSSTGHPILLGGPQAGYFDPQILVENELHSPTIHARGAAFPGLSPVVIIGRNQSEAWTATAGGGDMIDTYIEVLCDPDGGEADEQEVHYLFEGECVPMDRRVLREAPEPIAGQEALPDIIVERTVHGPVTGRGRIGDLAVAVSRKRSTYLKELDAGVSILRMNRGEGRTARDFVEIFRESHNLSTNWAYVNDSEIAFVHGGLYPIRPTDLDPDFPVWGTGENEWETGPDGEDVYLGVEEVPYDIDPERGYHVSWNNRQAPAWSANDSQWGYSSLYRADLLEDQVLATGPGEITPVRLVQMMEQAGLADLRGTNVYPTALEVLRAAPAPSAREERMVELLEEWIADGALRRDGDEDGSYDHGAAVAIADAWWTPMIRAVFDPALGRGVDTVSRAGFHNAPGSIGSAFQDGFYGQVFTDLSMALGRDLADPTSQVYCGSDTLGTDGDLVTCAERLWAALAAAGDAIADEQGDDPDAWDADAAGERIVFLPTAVLSMHWVNRPTTQVLAMFGRGAEPVTAGGTDPGGEGAPLPATGGGLLTGALAVLAAAGLLHRRRPRHA